MTSEGRPLPKFGEWDVNDPASAEGFTVIFAKAKDEKKTNNPSGRATSHRRDHHPNQASYQHPPPMKKWFCCF